MASGAGAEGPEQAATSDGGRTLSQGGGKALHAFVVPRKEAWDRARFLLERHGLRRRPDAPRYPLSCRPGTDVYDRRRSVRRFAPEPVGLDAVAALLAAADPRAGVLRAGVPSAAVPGLEIKLVAAKIDGLAPGLWRYDGAAGALRPAGPGQDCDVPDAGTARLVGDAPFVVLLDVPDHSGRAALLAAGAAGQRMMLAAQGAGLGLCPIGVLRYGGSPVLHALAGGMPAAETAGFDLTGALREHCAVLLPAWMVPRHIHLMEALPLSANGKLDRSALRPPGEAAAAAPADNATTETVGALVAGIIGHPVHPQQNLFDCGATSLHIVRLQRLLAEQLGSRLAVVDIFRLPSVAALAGAISGEAGIDAVDAGLTRAARRRQMRTRSTA